MRERCGRYAENLWMAEKMRKTYGESVDSRKDAEKMRRIVIRRERCGDVENA